MPVKSKAQMRKLYALEAEGKLPEGTVKKWLKKYGKPTEERIEKEASDDKDGKPAKPAPGFSVVGKGFSDARRSALKKQKPSKNKFAGKKAWEVPYSAEASKYFSQQIQDGVK